MQEEDYQRLLAAVVKKARGAVNANQAKSNFISKLSYELRTTLTNIMGMAQLLSMDCLLPTQQRCVTNILEGCEAILPLIDRLSNFSKLEVEAQSHIEFQTRSFDLKSVLEKVVSQLLYQAGVRGVQLLLDYQENVPITWVGHPNLIYHTILHLTSYALKNTEHGAVIIQVVSLVKEPKLGKAEVLLTIKDTGRGMEESELLEWRSCLEQLDSEHSQRYRIFNLGLDITLNYMRLLRATLEVESIVGKGSQFICRIPLKQANTVLKEANGLEKIRIANTSNLSALRILVIEDNEIIQRVYSSILGKIGVSFNIANTAADALEYYMQHRYDLILMDIALPDSNGMAITRIIRQQEAKEERVPIVALTAYGQPTDEKQFLQSGIDEVLIKPIKLETIYQLLQRWFKTVPLKRLI